MIEHPETLDVFSKLRVGGYFPVDHTWRINNSDEIAAT